MKKVHKKRIKRFFLTILIISLSLGIVFLSLAVKKFFVQSSLFLVRNISTNLDEKITPQAQRITIPSGILNNKNIFSVDIKALSKLLEDKYPEYKDIIVKRRFPDTLAIEFVRRIPLFQMKIMQSFWFVDEEYIIIEGPKPKPYPDMVEVYAVLPKSSNAFIGKKISFSHSDKVSVLLKELTAQGLMDSFKISKIYAYSLNDIWFDLEGVQIRVGSSDYAKKISLLRRLILPRFENDFKRIEYIDLRFKDYVVGYKR